MKSFVYFNECNIDGYQHMTEFSDKEFSLKPNIVSGERRIEWECHGHLSLQDAIDMIMAVKALDPRYHSFNRLYDLSHVTMPEISVSDFDEILMTGKNSFQQQTKAFKVAFVAQDNFILQTLAVFKTMSHRFHFQDVEYFNAREKALVWLNE